MARITIISVKNIPVQPRVARTRPVAHPLIFRPGRTYELIISGSDNIKGREMVCSKNDRYLFRKFLYLSGKSGYDSGKSKLKP